MIRYFFLLSSLFLFFTYPLHSEEKKTRQEILHEESLKLLEKAKKISFFYSLEDSEELKEITTEILTNEETNEEIKECIRLTGRRFFVFTYPSKEFKVKGTISFIPKPQNRPLLLFLRGGNRMFGLMHPANSFSCFKDYTVLSPAYRGGVSEGQDEFGGEEVEDIPSLISYLPVLEEKLGQAPLNPSSVFMLGGSRGGMEMFLALGRYPMVQKFVDKVVSLSGLLDLEECMRYRPDMRNMFIRDFGLCPEVNEKKWVDLRNPLLTIPNIRKNLPILIVQGTEDLRVSLEEGRHMTSLLTQAGNLVTYFEIPKASHCLSNIPQRMSLISDWLEDECPIKTCDKSMQKKESFLVEDSSDTN